MTFLEQVAKIADEKGMKKDEVKEVIESYTDMLVEELTTEYKCRVRNIGTISLKHRAERKGRNPRTKEEIIIPECLGAKLSVISALKEKIKNVDIQAFLSKIGK